MLKMRIEKEFPEVDILAHFASGVTGTIKVSWVKDGQVKTVWEKNKSDTIRGHEEIVRLLKEEE